MNDDYRLEVHVEDEEGGLSLGQRLRGLDLDDDVRERLGGRNVIVTRDGSTVFVYTGAEAQAREAERIVREVLAEHGVSATISLTRWHPVEEVWTDASVPLPETDEERRTEYARRERAEAAEADAEGEFDWHVRAELPSRRDAIDLSEVLEDEGIPWTRGWRTVVAGALTHEAADELAERIRAEAPAGTEVTIEVNVGDLPAPGFLFFP